MKDNILDTLNKIASAPDKIEENLSKIKALYDSKLEVNKTLAWELMIGEGYSPIQAKCILALLGEDMYFDERIAYDIIDETVIELEGFAVNILSKVDLEANIHPVAKLVNSAKGQYHSCPKNPNIEISLQERDSYFYMIFVADQLPFCLLGEASYIENVYKIKHGIKHLLSINLLSEMPEDVMFIPTIKVFLDIKPEISDYMMDWVNFREDENQANLEIIVESMNEEEDNWGLGIGFYNEDFAYISVLDLEIDESEMKLNQEDLSKLQKQYPHYLTPIEWTQGDLTIDEMRHVWTYNLLKNYL